MVYAKQLCLLSCGLDYVFLRPANSLSNAPFFLKAIEICHPKGFLLSLQYFLMARLEFNKL